MTSDTAGEPRLPTRIRPCVLPTAPRVAILGDSIIAGLGVARSKSYAMQVTRALNASAVHNVARTTQTIDQALALMPEIADFSPDLMLVSVGGADCLVHPGKLIEQALDRYGPESWRGVAGLEPRAVYVHPSAITRLRQRATTLIKVTVKHIGIALTGGYRRVEPEPFRRQLIELGERIATLECAVVVVPPGLANRRYFPGSLESSREYRAIISTVTADWPRTVLIDPVPLLTQPDDFGKDLVHLGPTGHNKLSVALMDVIGRSFEVGETP